MHRPSCVHRVVRRSVDAKACNLKSRVYAMQGYGQPYAIYAAWCRRSSNLESPTRFAGLRPNVSIDTTFSNDGCNVDCLECSTIYEKTISTTAVVHAQRCYQGHEL